MIIIGAAVDCDWLMNGMTLHLELSAFYSVVYNIDATTKQGTISVTCAYDN